MDSTFKSLLACLNDPDANTYSKLAALEEIMALSNNNLKELQRIAQNNRSLLVRFSNFWGKQTLRFKVTWGIALIVPLMMLSLLTHFLFLSFLCVHTTLLYIASNLLLDNDFNHRTQDNEAMGSLFNNLSKSYEAQIGTLIVLGTELKETADKLIFVEKNFQELWDKFKITQIEFDEKIVHLAKINETLEMSLKNIKIIATVLNDTLNTYIQSAAASSLEHAIETLPEKIRLMMQEENQFIKEVLGKLYKKMEKIDEKLDDIERTAQVEKASPEMLAFSVKCLISSELILRQRGRFFTLPKVEDALTFSSKPLLGQ